MVSSNLNQIRPPNLRPDFYRARSIKYLKKIRGIRRRLNLIQPGLNPTESENLFAFISYLYKWKMNAE
jgi:hypothetical protein